MLHTEKISHLPAYSIAEEVNKALGNHSDVVITAPPGAGKSTVLPLTILEGMKGKGIVLEPRRLAARQIAERMASLLDESVGETVGYRMRFETKVSPRTRLEVITEGILTRMLVSDPTLDGVDFVIFDEFHERSLASDTALALVREVQNLIRPDLKIIIMSATIDASNICTVLDAKLIESEGRMFPVTPIYIAPEHDIPTTDEVARLIIRAQREQDGDILVFLPGEAEIRHVAEALPNDSTIMPLYSRLSPSEQRAAIAPSPNGKRKTVLATSIAETSLTIEGVRVVIDSGLCRTMFFDKRNGMSHLETVRISHDMATQRMGRAGRLSEGVCYRMWAQSAEHGMQECRRPEILDADLSSLVLDIAAWGANDIEALPWLTLPPRGNVYQAQALLESLGAIRNGSITELGKRMSRIPCHPRISRILVADDNLKSLACDIAALLEEKDPLSHLTDDSDIFTRITHLRQARANGNLGHWSRIARISSEYCRMAHCKEDNTIPSQDEIGTLLALAYPERVGMALSTPGHFRLSSGDNAQVDINDTLSASKWIAVASLNAASGRIFLASPISKEALLLLSYDHTTVQWDSRTDRIIAQRQKRIGNLVIDSQDIQSPDRGQIIEAVCKAVAKSGVSLLDFSDSVAALQRRIETVKNWHPELSLPDTSTEHLLATADEWLPFYLEQVSGTIDKKTLRSLDLSAIILGMLTYEQQLSLDRLAPTHITVPTGSRIRIDYRQGAEAPVVSVRLQECFGLTDTPTVNDGKQPLLMELLSPGFKPVQLTKDLRSFWQETYFEVRKELRRRYPKHSWPDDPLTAPATRTIQRTANSSSSKLT
ncbi:MAG: ATP-dependent helicase HrpB [Prevotella sp.]|nr:ATP-dependent helicase HrpB [Prevotella sp.]